MSWFGSDAPVPGDPATMVDTGKHLTKLYGAFERAGNGFKAINTGGWYGDAADGFHSYLDIAAPKWFRASDAFESAGKAVAEYAATLEAAQRTAKQAKADLEAAKTRSNAAREQHNAAVEQANDSGGPPPPPFTDPAADDIAAATADIERAKADVQAGGDRAARVVLAAAQEAPAEPGPMTKLKENVVDGLQMQGTMLSNVGKGVLGGLDAMYQGVRTVMPFDPYNVTHPAGYAENMSGMAQGIAHSVTHPAQAFKTAVNWDTWATNPAKAAGNLLPSLAGTLFGVGAAGKAAGVASKLSKVSKTAGKIAEKVPGTGKADAPDGRPPAPAGRPNAPGGQPGGPPGGNGHAPPGGQPGTGTPWGNSDMPPAPNHPPDASTPDYSRPDGSFGPQGSSQPDMAEPPQNYSDGGRSRMPWEFDDVDDGGPDIPQRNPADEQPWRPSQDPPPSSTGERDLAQTPSERNPAGPDARPEHPGGDRMPDSQHDPVGSDYTGNSDFHADQADHQDYRDQFPIQEHEQRMINEAKEMYPDLRGVPDEEISAMKRYTGMAHQDINEALRTGDLEGMAKHDTEITNMTSGMNKLPDWAGSPEYPQIYRGIEIDNPDDMANLLQRYEPGSMVQENAFTSGDKVQGHSGNVEFVINPTHAKDLEFANPYGHQNEVAWPPGNKFEVTGRRFDENEGKWIIHMNDHGR